MVVSRRMFLGRGAVAFAAAGLAPWNSIVRGADEPGMMSVLDSLDEKLPGVLDRDQLQELIRQVSEPTQEERILHPPTSEEVAAVMGNPTLKGRVRYIGSTPQQMAQLTALTALRAEVEGYHSRLDRVEGKVVYLVERVDIIDTRLDELDKKVAILCEGEKKLETELNATVSILYDLGRILQECNSRLDDVNMTLSEVNSLLQQVNCTLEQVNCIMKQVNCLLCKLPEAIRRAKIRAFIFGFLVGMGVGAAIGGGAGGAMGSVSIW